MGEFSDILKNSNGFLCLSPVSNKDIENAEEELGIKFAEDYKQYLLDFGAAMNDEHEFTGICNSPRLSVVEVTKEYKAENDYVPSNWYVIEKLGIDGIVIWQSSRGKIYQTIGASRGKKIADSLIEYIQL